MAQDTTVRTWLDSARQALDQALAQADARDDRAQLVALMRTSRDLNRLRNELLYTTDPATQAALAATAARFAEKARLGFHLFSEEAAA